MRYAVFHEGQSCGVRYAYVVRYYRARGAAMRFADWKNSRAGREGVYLVREVE